MLVGGGMGRTPSNTLSRSKWSCNKKKTKSPDLVDVFGDGEVVVGVDPGRDQVVAVHRRRHGHLGQPGGHELQQRHLRGGVLHGDAVGPQIGVGATPLDLLVLGVVEVVDQDLFGERERTPQASATDRNPLGQRGVDALHEFDRSVGW